MGEDLGKCKKKLVEVNKLYFDSNILFFLIFNFDCNMMIVFFIKMVYKRFLKCSNYNI